MENAQRQISEQDCLMGAVNTKKPNKKSFISYYYELLLRLKDREIEDKNIKIAQLEETIEKINHSLKEIQILLQYNTNRISENMEEADSALRGK